MEECAYNRKTLGVAHRNITMVPTTQGGAILSDFIDALGTRAYRIFLPKDQRTKANPQNVLLNPSFEYW
jgi:hypothetical protein